MIDLVFPLSLPLPTNDFAGQDQARRRQALDCVVQALAGAGLQRSRRFALQTEAQGVPKALAHELWLQDALALPCADAASVLALRAQATGLTAAPPGRQAWLLRPVHLHLGLDHLVLAAAEANSFNLNKPEAWVERLSEALEPGWALQAWCGARGETFLRLETPAAIDWQPRSALQASGRSIEVYLPQGADARLWRRFLNHAQMLLHEHPLNELRAAAGALAVNGLWLEGRIQDQAEHTLHRLKRGETPPNFASGPAPQAAHQILFFEDWIAPAQQGDLQAWEELWKGFPSFANTLRQQLAPAQELRWHFFGESSRLSLQSGPGDAWRFWRRPLPASF